MHSSCLEEGKRSLSWAMQSLTICSSERSKARESKTACAAVGHEPARGEREERKRRTKQAQEELLALVEDAQRSGNVVVYYRFSDTKDCDKSVGKVCRMYPPHSRHMHVHSRTHLCVRTRACVCVSECT